MKISDFAFNEIQKLVEDGYVRKSQDKEKVLSIYTYTPKAEFDNVWNERPFCRTCRGLVLDDENKEIVIKCIEKFFNHETEFAEKISINDSETEITLKEDGYLIQIVKTHEYGLVITSKGSFDNKYVECVKRIIDTFGIEKELEYDIVYVCELLANFAGDEGIIVTKHSIERLVCFAMIDKETGKELYLTKKCPFEKVYAFSPDEAKEYLTQEVEGVVLHNWETGKRVKMKTEWFFKMHKLISNCTKKTVYETLKEGKRVEDLDIPDEFMNQMKEWQKEILDLFNLYEYNAKSYFEIFKDMSDKEFATLSGNAVPKNYVNLVFMLRKNKKEQFDEIIWRLIKQKI